MGVDVIAVTQRPDLEGKSDEAVLRAAREEGRVVLTNNVRDYAPLVEAFGLRGEQQFGVLFTDDDTFSRADEGIGRLTRSLQIFVAGRSDDWLLDGCMYLPPA